MNYRKSKKLLCTCDYLSVIVSLLPKVYFFPGNVSAKHRNSCMTRPFTLSRTLCIRYCQDVEINYRKSKILLCTCDYLSFIVTLLPKVSLFPGNVSAEHKNYVTLYMTRPFNIS